MESAVEETPVEIQNRIIEKFQEVGDAFNQFTYLLQLASEFPELPEGRKTKDVLVQGCQSQVWLYASAPGGRMHIEGDSDTLMVRGVIRILSLMFEGQKCEAILACPIEFVEKTDLTSIFDAKRKAGVASIVEAIRDVAKEEM